jgi:large subunit ribosomal protein L10
MKILTKEKKKEFMEMLANEIKTNDLNLLVRFTGLSVLEIQQLREELKGSGCKMMVVRNTLLSRVYKDISFDEMSDEIGGPMFIIWAKDMDEIGVVKALFKFKGKAGKIDIRAGIIDNKFFSSRDLEAIGKLPTKKEIEVKIVWGLKTPFLRLVYSLKYPVMRVIQDFKQIGESKK